MANVKWIKIVTDIFDDEKILLIESLPDAYAIIVVWFKLLCLAGKQNNNGVFMMGQIAYTDKMLATIFRMKETTVTMALQTFEQFGMVEIVDGVITIPNWGKHQNLDRLESKKEYMRNYMNEYREKQKKIACKLNSKSNCKPNGKSNVSQTEEDIEREEDIEKEDKSSLLPEAETASDPNPSASMPSVVITLPLNDKTEYPITEEDVTAWAFLYPAVDIMQELRKMKGWAEANPTKRKTKNGVKRFINSWLSKEQDKYHGPTGGGQHGGFEGATAGKTQKYGTYV